MVSFALHGMGVSGGIAIGRAQLVSHATLEVAHYHISAQQVGEEIARSPTSSASSNCCTARSPPATSPANSARSSTCTG